MGKKEVLEIKIDDQEKEALNLAWGYVAGVHPLNEDDKKQIDFVCDKLLGITRKYELEQILKSK